VSLLPGILLPAVSFPSGPAGAPERFRSGGGPRVLLLVHSADGEEAALVIADEWGEVYSVADAGTGHRFPTPPEIIEWVRFLAIQCPECEGPEGEWKTVW
jgi:hypothetical protein